MKARYVPGFFFREIKLRIKKIITIAPFVLFQHHVLAASCEETFAAKQYSEAFTLCREDSEDNNANASFIMAKIYARGLSVNTNVDQSISYLTHAAELSHPEAMFNLAVAFELGKGLVKSSTDAFDWYVRSAEAGFIPAQRKVALMYEKGKGTAVDAKHSYEWYKKAAEAGESHAQLKLGAILLQDKVVPKDIEAGLSWIEKSAKQGEVEAQFALATLLWNRDVEQSLYWFEQAAENGNNYAMHNLASIYLKGEKVAIDLDKSEYYAKMSVANGQAASEKILLLVEQLRAKNSTPVIDETILDEETLAQNSDNTKAASSETAVASVSISKPQSIDTNTQQTSEAESSTIAASSSNMISEQWLPESGFIIQFAKIHSQAGVEHFINKYQLLGMVKVLPLEREGAYLVVSDPFTTWQQANSSLAKLSQEVKVEQPWIRNNKAVLALL